MPTRNFLSSGKKGDLHYQLYVIRALGGGNLYITKGEFEEPLESVLASCGRLLGSQSYVKKFDIHRGEPINVDLDAFRKSPYLYRTTLLDILCRAHEINLPTAVEGWIEVPPDMNFSDKIVIHRRTTVVKERANALFDWNKLLEVLGPRNCVFVSRLETEWRDFCHPEVEYHCPKDNYEHARIIRACRLFVGNTCFGTALADALGVNRIIEVSYGLDRKHFAVTYAPNAWYFANPWDCTIKSFRYLKTGSNGSYLDLATNRPATTLEPYRFSWWNAFGQELRYQGHYRKFLLKQWIKRTAGLV